MTFRKNERSSVDFKDELQKIWHSISGNNLLEDNKVQFSNAPSFRIRIQQYFEELITSNNNETSIARETALWQKDNTITFGELNQRANLVARTLRRVLIDHDSAQMKNDGQLKLMTIAALMPVSIDAVTLLLATLKLGVSLLPLDLDMSQTEMQAILAAARPSAVLSESDQMDLLHDACVDCDSAVVMCFQDMLDLGHDRHFKTEDLHDNETFSNVNDPVAFQIFCSCDVIDSITPAHLIKINQGSIFNRINWLWTLLPLKNHEVGCFHRPFSKLDVIIEILACLFKGIPLCVMDYESDDVFLDKLKYFYVTRIVLTPTQLTYLLITAKARQQQQFICNSTNHDCAKEETASRVEAEHRLLYMETVICTSEILSVSLASRFFQLLPNGKILVNMYSNTRTAGQTCAAVFRSLEEVEKLCWNDCLTVGEPASNINISILDPTSHSKLSFCQIGQLCISCDKEVDGSSKFGAADEKFFDDNFFVSATNRQILLKTDDMAFVNEDLLFIKGKKQDSLKVFNRQIFCSDFDSLLLQHKSVASVRTLLISTSTTSCSKSNQLAAPLSSDKFVLFYALDQFAQVDTKELLNLIDSHLRVHHLSGIIRPVLVRLDKLPRTQSGVINCAVLRDCYFHAAFNITKEDVSSQDDDRLEKCVRKVVSKCVGVNDKQVAMYDNFFLLGGDSVAAVRCVESLSEQGKCISLRTFSQAQSLQDVVIILRYGINVLDISEQCELYSVELMDVRDKEAALHLLSQSLVQREALCLLLACQYEQIYRWLEDMWPHMLATGVSTCIRRLRDNQLIAASVAISADADIFDNTESQLEILSLFFSHCKVFFPRRSEKCKEERWLTILAASTDIKLAVQESVELLQRLEFETLQMAIKKGFHVVKRVNTNPVTQHVCQQLGYQTISQQFLHEFEIHGIRPFCEIENEVLAWVAVRRLGYL